MAPIGPGAGADMWDEVVRPFATNLATAGRWKEAREAVVLARETMGVPYGSQMDTEMRELEAALAAQARKAAAAR